jgi:hypothetical protein
MTRIPECPTTRKTSSVVVLVAEAAATTNLEVVDVARDVTLVTETRTRTMKQM